MTTNKSLENRHPILVTDKKTKPQNPLIASPSAAEREMAGLRRGQAERDAAPGASEGDARASLI